VTPQGKHRGEALERVGIVVGEQDTPGNRRRISSRGQLARSFDGRAGIGEQRQADDELTARARPGAERADSGPAADFIDVIQQVRRILVHTNGASPLELILTVATRQ